MPNLTQNEIKEAIADNRILALTLDTAVFKAKNYDFRNPSLKGLNQFLGTDIAVILSEVVVREMKRHVAELAAETQRAAKKAFRSHVRRWKLRDTEALFDQLAFSKSPIDEASLQVDRFMAADGIEGVAVPTSEDFTRNVLERYFKSKTPFEKSEKKKHEFPDAYALLSLETWSLDNEKMVLCVSPDKGWKAFCDASENLICIDSLDTALSYFNEAFQDIANTIVDLWRAGEAGEYIDRIASAFEERLEDLNFHIDADANTFFEAEMVEAILQYVDPTSVGDPIVIASDEETITFGVSVEAVVAFRAIFNFYIIDGIDKDEVPLGAEEAEKEEALIFDLMVTADRKIDDVPVFHEVRVSQKNLNVHFGHVEAFPNEDPTHPKY